MNDLSLAIHERLLDRHETVATAESLTAGLVSAALTASPGTSATFRGGLIVYATDLKSSLAGVPADLLADRGPVDPDVAAWLAVGALDRLGATWGLALTGVAGPDPQAGAPVGRLYVAVSDGSDEPEVRRFELSGDRDAIRAAAVRAALTMLRDTLADALT